METSGRHTQHNSLQNRSSSPPFTLNATQQMSNRVSVSSDLSFINGDDTYNTLVQTSPPISVPSQESPTRLQLDHGTSSETLSVNSQKKVFLNKPHPAPRRRGLYSRAITDGWLLEVVCLILAVIFTGGIALIVKQYNGEELGQWPYSITLNSSIALLSTLAKSTLMIPIASCLSQLKWTRFTKRTRSLVDLQTYDDASRGALGSLELLTCFKGGLLASIGAITSILAVAAATATQQIISTELVNVPYTKNASVGRCQNYSTITWTTEFGETIPIGGSSTPALSAISQGLWMASGDGVLDLEPTCSTGNCTWGSFYSLGVCASEPANLTSQLYREALPNGVEFYDQPGEGFEGTAVTLNTVFLWPNASYTDDHETSEVLHWMTGTSLGFPDAQFPLADIYFLYWEENRAYAIEYLLQLCVRNYTITTFDTVTSTVLGDPIFNTSFTGPFADADTVKFEDVYLTISVPDADEMFSTNWEDYYSLQNALMMTFEESAYNSGEALAGALGLNGTTTGTTQRSVIDSLNGVVNNISLSLTTMMRESNSSQAQLGTAYTTVTIFTVRWPWISYLLGLILLSFLVLVATMLESKKTQIPIWRSSVDPLLRIMQENSQERIEGAGFTSNMQARSRLMTVILEEVDGHWKIKERVTIKSQDTHESTETSIEP